MARASKPKRERDRQITLRVTEAENKAFRDKADAVGMDLNTWIRQACRKFAEMPTAQ